MNGDGLLKMAELSERSGVSPATIKHYLREGLLGGEEAIVKTSRNMAWYAPELVERLKLIKRMQEEEYLPLKVIRDRLADRRLLEAAVRARGAAGDGAGERVPRDEAARQLPPEVLDKLEELGVLTPGEDGYDAEDMRIVDAFVRFRAGGYDEHLGFTVYDTLRYQRALAPLVEEEVAVLLENLRDEDRAADIIVSGAEPLRELIGAMHSKMLLAALERRRDAD